MVAAMELEFRKHINISNDDIIKKKGMNGTLENDDV